ncbi:uncharacterized protein ACIQIH_010314 isoform 1-T1 [Cyanocitta cristata]
MRSYFMHLKPSSQMGFTCKKMFSCFAELLLSGGCQSCRVKSLSFKIDIDPIYEHNNGLVVAPVAFQDCRGLYELRVLQKAQPAARQLCSIPRWHRDWGTPPSCPRERCSGASTQDPACCFQLRNSSGHQRPLLPCSHTDLQHLQVFAI